MKRKRIAPWFAFVLTFALVLTACSGQPAPTPPASGGNGAAPVETKDPIKIGALTSLSGALQDYGQQMQRGFELGLEYATDGTLEVAGRKLQLIWEDTTTVPDVARERAVKLLDQDDVDLLVGCASSSDAAAILELAEEFERVLILEPAAADFLTGSSWNRYIFRTGRNTAQDAAAIAAVMTHSKEGVKVATLAPDSAYGHSSVDSFLLALEEKGGTIVHQEYAPAETTDFAPYILRIREAQPDFLYVVWAGANNPWNQLSEMNLSQYGITISTHAAEIAALRMMKSMVGLHGFTIYYHTLPDNPVNNWLVERHQEKFGTPPDIFTSGGMAAAMAVVTALEKTGGSTDTETLIQTMRGMEFDSPSGTRYFREEDHQAIQNMFEVRLVEGSDHAVPELIRVIPAEEILPPISVPADAKR